MAGKKKQSFEEGMEQLERLVAQLERSELPLEQSFAAYEQGKVLAATLAKMLDENEQRMVELTSEGEKPLTLEGEA